MIHRGEVPKGYKKTEVGIIPEDWEVKRLKDVANINKSQLSNNTDGNYEFYYFDLSSVSEGKISLPQSKMKFKDAPSRARRIFSKYHILMSTVRPYLKGFAYVDFEKEDCICSTGFAVIASNNKYDSLFIYHNIFSSNISNQINRLLVGSNYPAINQTDVEELKIPYCKKNNERKIIAQILSTWDKAIELKEKLLEEKKKQKKGLMQRLLTGEVRLHGFDGEWEEVRLGDIGQTYNGLSGKTAKDFGEGKPYITYKNIFENSKVDIKDVDYVKISKNENQNLVRYGDIFFTTSSETPNEVGMSSVLLDKVEELYLNSFCFGFRLYNFETLVPEYARYLFRGETFRGRINKLAQGSTRFNLSKNEVMKLKVILPSVREQQAIAQILSTADKEIELLEKELEQLKTQKKGLMQLLLTGIVRVKT